MLSFASRAAFNAGAMWSTAALIMDPLRLICLLLQVLRCELLRVDIDQQQRGTVQIDDEFFLRMALFRPVAWKLVAGEYPVVAAR
jgi:hypothetical protein